MADKKPKKASSSRIPLDKLLTVKPELVTPSQLVKFDSHQITTGNSPDKPSSSRIVSLGKLVQNSSFAKALTSDYDPFNKHIVPSTPAAPIKSRKIKTSHFFSLYDEKKFHIEFIHKNITNPLSLIKYYFFTHPTDGAQQHLNPPDLYKTIQFYQNILLQEGSIIITSIYDQFSDKKLLYHKIEIIKFTSMRQWGIYSFVSKPLRGHPIQYSYYDYIDAWFKIILHQNDNMSHSWFLTWHEKYDFTKPKWQPPMLFIKWWSKHGSQAEIIPDTLWVTKIPVHHNDPPLSTYTLRETLLHFTKMYKCSEYNSRFPPILLFCTKYKVPWIVKWNYQIKENILIRNFVVKWWDKYNRDRIIKFVYDEFPIKGVKELEDKPSSFSIQDLLKGKCPKELAEICKMAAIQCQSASASGKHSPTSLEGSTNAKEVAQFPYPLAPMPSNWY